MISPLSLYLWLVYTLLLQDGVRRRRGGPGGTAPHRDHQIPCSQLPTDGACTTPGLKL